MKLMSRLEMIVRNNTGCCRETANRVANDIITEAEKQMEADIAKLIFTDINNLIMPIIRADETEAKIEDALHGSKDISVQKFTIADMKKALEIIEKKYTGGQE